MTKSKYDKYNIRFEFGPDRWNGVLYDIKGKIKTAKDITDWMERSVSFRKFVHGKMSECLIKAFNEVVESNYNNFNDGGIFMSTYDPKDPFFHPHMLTALLDYVHDKGYFYRVRKVTGTDIIYGLEVKGK